MSKKYFEFMSKRLTMEPTFFMHKLKEKYREKKGNFSMIFIHLEKEFDKLGLKRGISDGYKSKKGHNGICKNTGYVG